MVGCTIPTCFIVSQTKPNCNTQTRDFYKGVIHPCGFRMGISYGGIAKLPGNRRKPYRVRLSVGWKAGEDGKVRQQYRTLGYYATREEAMRALADYHANPYTMEQNITFREVYDRWSAEKYPTISRSGVNGYKASYNVCGELYDVRFRDIRRNHLQAVVDECGKNYPTLRKLRDLFSQLFTYAIQNDLCDKDYSEFIDIAKHKDPDAEQKHKPFTKEELKTIIQNAGRSRWIAATLMMIYSGVRIGEFVNLKKEDVHLEERYFDVRKSKTAAGIRKVPIARTTLPYWRQFMSEPEEYVITNANGNPIDDNTYRSTYFVQPLEQIGIMNHLPHDTRHSCVSLLTAAGVDRILIKRIVGHQGEDVTDMVYTHYDIDQLIEAIDKIDGVIG